MGSGSLQACYSKDLVRDLIIDGGMEYAWMTLSNTPLPVMEEQVVMEERKKPRRVEFSH
jgi:hypothetical protein